MEIARINREWQLCFNSFLPISVDVKFFHDRKKVIVPESESIFRLFAVLLAIKINLLYWGELGTAMVVSFFQMFTLKDLLSYNLIELPMIYTCFFKFIPLLL